MSPLDPTASYEVELPLRRRKRRQSGAGEADMDITPMIDVTFLLLIFFLVTSQMTPGREVQLPEARHGTSVSSRHVITLTVSVPATRDGLPRVFAGDGKQPDDLLPVDDTATQDAAIGRYVQQQLAANPSEREVLIKAERAVKHRDVARVARVASQADQLPLFVAVKEVQ